MYSDTTFNIYIAKEGDHWGGLGVDNIRMDLQEMGCRYMDWIGLAQDRDR